MNWRSTFALALWLLAPPVAGYDELILEAERKPATPLVIHAALDLPYARPLLEDFHRRHPQYTITFRNFSTLEVHERFLTDPTEADVMISSAMPWQYLLVNDGHAQPVETPTTEAWPTWAKWRQELFAFSFEPIVMVVNQDIRRRYGPVTSHAELLALLREHGQALTGRIVTYDPAASGAGYTYAIEESRLSPRYWDLIAALGRADTQLVDTTGAMLEGLADGRFLIGYNLLGSYAREAIAGDPDLDWVIPDDYALVIQRLAFVPRLAPHPGGARRFIDYLLGTEGQRVLADAGALGAVHPELDGPGTATDMRRRYPDGLRPMPLSPGLLATLDELKRQALLGRWQREFLDQPVGAAP
ncbi:ABC transporter substrate-binding protein [Halomonas sp. V046]|uniref:ABC transporter substrate-binding protein n=1 Tax=Halomonas sp. V046 TaxID=3459611 RepID=UPI0040450C6E